MLAILAASGWCAISPSRSQFAYPLAAGMVLVSIGTLAITVTFGLRLRHGAAAAMGRRGIPLQWSASSWRPILGYRPWRPPAYPQLAPLRIVMRHDKRYLAAAPILQTTQFALVRTR